jgi:hypothetical protein
LIIYNLAATLSLALSAWLAQLAILRVVPSRVAAFLGALFFGFSPYMMGHAWGHLTITLAFFPPLTLLLLHETLCRQRWRPWITGTFAGVLLTFQLVTFIETVAIVVVGVVIVVVLLMLFRRRMIREKLTYATHVVWWTGVAFVISGAYPLRTLLFGAQRLGHGTVQEPESFITDVVNFVVPTETTRFVPSFIAGTSAHITNGVESGGYVGIPILLVCLLAVILLRRQLVVQVAAITGVALAIFSLGPRPRVDGSVFNIPLPFALLLHLPLFGNILAAQLLGVADLCFGVLIAAFAAHLRDVRLPWRLSGFALLAAGFFAIVPAPLPMPTQPYSIPSYFTTSAVDRIPSGSVALVAPFDTSGADISPELWQAASDFRFRMPEGYVYVPSPSGPITGPLPTPLGGEMSAIEYAPPGTALPAISRSERRIYRADIRAWGVSTVLVGPMPNENVMVEFFDRVVGRKGVVAGGVTAWYNVHG